MLTRRMLTGVLAAASGLRALAAPRPNIVFILADGLGYGDLGCCDRIGNMLTRRMFTGALAAAGRSRAQAAPRPNIVFILADGLGYGDLGYYG